MVHSLTLKSYITSLIKYKYFIYLNIFRNLDKRNPPT